MTFESEFDPSAFSHRPDCHGANIDTHCLGCTLAEREAHAAEIEKHDLRYSQMRELAKSALAVAKEDTNRLEHQIESLQASLKATKEALKEAIIDCRTAYDRGLSDQATDDLQSALDQVAEISRLRDVLTAILQTACDANEEKPKKLLDEIADMCIREVNDRAPNTQGWLNRAERSLEAKIREQESEDARKTMITWKELLEQAMRERGETLADLEANTLTEADMVKEFYSGYSGTEGVPFTAWTAKTVYFPVVYDGAEWVGSVSRHPDGKPTEHQGGGRSGMEPKTDALTGCQYLSAPGGGLTPRLDGQGKQIGAIHEA